jgi:hypothetical protein
MEPSYTYIPSPDYISNLSFAYIETYSFQRGTVYEENLQLIRPEYDRLKVRKEKRNNLAPAEEERFAILKSLLGFTQYLVNDYGEFHPSAKKTNTFQADEPMVTKLISILKTEIREIPSWMCAPTYRDAIVFYDVNNNIVSVLNICLDCSYMATKMFNHINADYETYDLLKRFFIEIGHDVEDPGNQRFY